jgi:hypothetical protein
MPVFMRDGKFEDALQLKPLLKSETIEALHRGAGIP